MISEIQNFFSETLAQLLRNWHHQVPAFESHLILKWKKKTNLHVNMYEFILPKEKKMK